MSPCLCVHALRTWGVPAATFCFFFAFGGWLYPRPNEHKTHTTTRANPVGQCRHWPCFSFPGAISPGDKRKKSVHPFRTWLLMPAAHKKERAWFSSRTRQEGAPSTGERMENNFSYRHENFFVGRLCTGIIIRPLWSFAAFTHCRKKLFI